MPDTRKSKPLSKFGAMKRVDNLLLRLSEKDRIVVLNYIATEYNLGAPAGASGQAKACNALPFGMA